MWYTMLARKRGKLHGTTAMYTFSLEPVEKFPFNFFRASHLLESLAHGVHKCVDLGMIEH